MHRSVASGTTMEVDFGESWVDIAGTPREVKYLVATLPCVVPSWLLKAKSSTSEPGSGPCASRCGWRASRRVFE